MRFRPLLHDGEHSHGGELDATERDTLLVPLDKFVGNERFGTHRPDSLTELTLGMGGEVVMVPSAELPTKAGTAAICWFQPAAVLIVARAPGYGLPRRASAFICSLA